MKVATMFFLFCFSLSAFAAKDYECFARKGKFGVETSPMGKLILNNQTATFKQHSPREKKYNFSNVSVEHTRTGTWSTYTSNADKIAISEGGEVLRVYLTTQSITRSIKCMESK